MRKVNNVATQQEITCKCGCGRKKMVRTADINRGWGKFFSKSCKAKFQESKIGQMRRYLINKDRAMQREDEWNFDDMNGHFSNETSNQF